MLKLSIIGCGNVAKTMAYLWHKSNNVRIVDVVNRSQQSADKSVDFIGAGRALTSINELNDADAFVIGSGDDDIEDCLDQLLKLNVVKTNTLIFHFSGAKSSQVLNEAKSFNAICASLHPVKSFADPKVAIKTFENTYCGIEGDNHACEILKQLIDSISSHWFKVQSDKKLTYHAASVFACNYLNALQELSIQAYEHSGINRELAMNILEPIVKETSNNIFKLGTADSLTGPIARGDHKLVAQQYAAVADWNSDAAEIYRLLGKISTELSEQKGASQKVNLEQLRKLFK